MKCFEGKANGRIKVSCHANVVFQSVRMVSGKEHGGEKVCGLKYDLLLIVAGIYDYWSGETREWISLGVRSSRFMS